MAELLFLVQTLAQRCEWTNGIGEGIDPTLYNHSTNADKTQYCPHKADKV